MAGHSKQSDLQALLPTVIAEFSAMTNGRVWALEGKEDASEKLIADDVGRELSVISHSKITAECLIVHYILT